MFFVLLIFALIMLLGGWPSLGIHQLGYVPSSVGVLLLIVCLVLLLMET